MMPPPAGAVQPTPSADGRPAYERSWSELVSREQEACRVLGYDRRVWDEERSELAAARMMAAENDDEEWRQAEQQLPDAPASGGFDFSASERTNSGLPVSRLQPAVSVGGHLQPAVLTVAVVDTELDEHTSSVFYVMDIDRPAAPQFADAPQRVRKRYSEFESLRKELSAISRWRFAFKIDELCIKIDEF